MMASYLQNSSVEIIIIYLAPFLLIVTLLVFINPKKKDKENYEDDDFKSSVLFIGMDCEMVGCGRKGEESMLARCSLVTLDDGKGEDKEEDKKSKYKAKIDGIKVLYDAFVLPTKPITDYRTKWSGITKERLEQDDVINLQECRRRVLDILTLSSQSFQIVVLVGHALQNDLDVLNIQHPHKLIRDTAFYRPYMRKGERRFYHSSSSTSSAGQRKSTKYYPRKLAELSKEYLGLNIQHNNQLNKNGGKIQVGHDSIEDAASSLLLYKKASIEWEQSLDFPLEKLLKERQQLSDAKEGLDFDYKDHKDFSSAVLFVGMDCEMVGVGRNGSQSMLARCSIVTLIEVSEDNKENEGGEKMRKMRINKDNFQKTYKIKVLYDKYVLPTRNITDYRTQWSGITKERLEQDDVINLQECRRNVMEILSSSLDGRQVVLVGHALKNDFEVLNIYHPHELTRDTASYRPYMRQARKRHYPRKLSELCREKLGIHIQNSGISKSMFDKNGKLSINYRIGHDSVEDAAASLLLYQKASLEWERSLQFPLRALWKQKQNLSASHFKQNKGQGPFITLYLDGCNLPLGLRKRKGCVDPNFKYQLLSKDKGEGNMTKTPIDWIPLLRSITSSPSKEYDAKLRIAKVCIFFDGAMFTDEKSKIARPQTFNDLGGGVYLEISDNNVEVDDILVRRCIDERFQDNIPMPEVHNRDIKSVEDIIMELKDGLVDNEVGFSNKDHGFYVVKRKAGGSKTNKKLFDKLCLRRAAEGAFCLMPSLVNGNPRLQKNSLAVAKRLQQAKVYHIVEYERRLCKDIRSIVVTDDVLLSDRVVNAGGVVLRYNQLRQLI